MSKLTMLTAAAAGYVLGARAGRERYEQIAAGARVRRPQPQGAVRPQADAGGRRREGQAGPSPSGRSPTRSGTATAPAARTRPRRDVRAAERHQRPATVLNDRLLPHPVTGRLFASPVPPGTGWPEDPAGAGHPVARTAGAVDASPRPRPRALDARVSVCRACPRLVRVARGRRARQAGVVPRPALLGPADRRLGRPGARRAGRRAGARRQRRQPHRPDLHRRPLRGLAVRGPAPGRASPPCRPAPTPATARARRHPDGGGRALRAAGQPAHGRRARHLRAVPDRELALLAGRVRVVVALGGFGWDAALRGLPGARAATCRGPQPRFGHGAEALLGAPDGTSCCSAATTRASRTRSPAG